MVLPVTTAATASFFTITWQIDWVVSDFAFPALTRSITNVLRVSKTNNPVAGGWWLYALQVDPAHPNFLGDYPKFGMWPDAYCDHRTCFPITRRSTACAPMRSSRTDMINGTGAPNPGAIGFTIDAGDAGRCLQPGAGECPHRQCAARRARRNICSRSTAPRPRAQWKTKCSSGASIRIFLVPANSTFGVGANHAPNAAITVANFVDAFTSAGTTIVPQNGTTRTLDTLGDKSCIRSFYQNLNGTESLWATQTVNNNQNGTGPTAVRWYQFNVTGRDVLPAAPGAAAILHQWRDGLWRFMPSIAVDR